MRRLLPLSLCFLTGGCALLSPPPGQPHPDFNTELLIQIMDDLDQFITSYAWVLPLIGL